MGDYGGRGSTSMKHRQWLMCHTGRTCLTADISESFKRIASHAIIWTPPCWRKRRLCSIKKAFHLASCLSCKVDAHPWCLRFESRPWHWLSWLRSFLVLFSPSKNMLNWKYVIFNNIKVICFGVNLTDNLQNISRVCVERKLCTLCSVCLSAWGGPESLGISVSSP
jgi:hypothetical protein